MNTLFALAIFMQVLFAGPPESHFVRECGAPLSMASKTIAPTRVTFDPKCLELDRKIWTPERLKAEDDEFLQYLETDSALMRNLIQSRDFDGFSRYCLRTGLDGKYDDVILDFLGEIIDLGWEQPLLYLRPGGAVFESRGGPLLTAYILAWRDERPYGMREYLETVIQSRIQGIRPFVEKCAMGAYAVHSDRALASLAILDTDASARFGLAVIKRLATSTDSTDQVKVVYATYLTGFEMYEQALAILKPLIGKCKDAQAKVDALDMIKICEERIAERDFGKKK